jgi:hypothetical protein
MNSLDRYLNFLNEASDDEKDEETIRNNVEKIKDYYDQVNKRVSNKYSEMLKKLSKKRKEEIKGTIEAFKERTKDKFFSYTSPTELKWELDDKIEEITDNYREKAKILANAREEELESIRLERSVKISSYLTALGVVSASYGVSKFIQHKRNVKKAEKKLKQFNRINREYM